MESLVFDVRRLDRSGRLPLPPALRVLLGWAAGDAIAIRVAADGEVHLERRNGEAELAAPEDETPPP